MRESGSFPRRRATLVLTAVVVGVTGALSAAAIVFAVVGDGGGSSSDGHTHSPSEYAGTALDRPAPDFTLTDQHGREVSLSDFQDNMVVLTFMDTKCTDTCPLTALEFRTAHASLAEMARDVVFIGVNVNVTHNGIADVNEFTVKQRLTELTNWHFLTGPEEQLQPVWADYQIEVREISGAEEFGHTPGVYVIDATGEIRWYVSTPLIEENLIEEWQGPRLSDILVHRIQELVAES